jgi:hypothetical protein
VSSDVKYVCFSDDGAEDRGDLIVFYNSVYVLHMRSFSVKLSNSSNAVSFLHRKKCKNIY